MKIQIVSVGKIKDNFWKQAQSEYCKMISRFCDIEVIELQDEKIPDKVSDNEALKILDKEGQKILPYINTNNTYTCSMAIEGKQYDSVEFAELLRNIFLTNSKIVFVIGGSLGITSDIKKKSDKLISLSKMTFPHRLSRVILLEQIFRAFKINNNETYHK